MYIQPPRCVCFMLADLISNLGMKDLCAATRHAAQTGVDEFFEK